MTIFDIDERIRECVDLETGEILDEEALAALTMKRGEKVEGVLLDNATEPRIDEISFNAAVDEILDGFVGEDERELMLSDDKLPYLAITAAIHEFSKMINGHIINMIKEEGGTKCKSQEA